MHTNKIHVKLGHPEEDRMCATKNHLHYSVKAVLEVFEYCAVVKINNTLLCKTVEERYLNLGEMIHLYIIQQKKPRYGGYNI